MWPRVDPSSDNDFIKNLGLWTLNFDYPLIRLVIALDDVDGRAET